MLAPSKPCRGEDFLLDLKNAIFDKTNDISFMGWKTCSEMLAMIDNKEVFRQALRIVKLWARRRGIYGFNLGYLNGISLVIMLLKA